VEAVEAVDAVETVEAVDEEVEWVPVDPVVAVDPEVPEVRVAAAVLLPVVVVLPREVVPEVPPVVLPVVDVLLEVEVVATTLLFGAARESTCSPLGVATYTFDALATMPETGVFPEVKSITRKGAVGWETSYT
jgi:hypothetical protein